MKLQPKNWSTFQHYKDRNPPWIKLHKDQLNKPDFMSLSLASVGLANMLWLLASETKDGVFDASMEHLTFRLRKTEREIKANLKSLIDKGFFVVACGVLADDTESRSEGEVEGEAYKEETEAETALGKSENLPLPDFITESTWDEFKKMRVGLKKKMTPAAEKRMINKLTKFHDDGHDIETVLDQSILNSWSDVYEPKQGRTEKPTRKRKPMLGYD